MSCSFTYFLTYLLTHLAFTVQKSGHSIASNTDLCPTDPVKTMDPV